MNNNNNETSEAATVAVRRRYCQRPALSPQYGTLVPQPGVNYPDWVIGPFDLGDGLFFLLDQNRKTGTGKTGQTVALVNN